MKYPYIRIYGEFYFKYIIKIFDICVKLLYDIVRDAEVSELADEQDSGSCERYAREGSSPFFRMIKALADARAFFLMFLSIFQNVKIIHINIKILHLEGG